MVQDGVDSDMSEDQAQDYLLEQKKQCLLRARSKQLLLDTIVIESCLIYIPLQLRISNPCVFFFGLHQGFLRKLLTILELQHPS